MEGKRRTCSGGRRGPTSSGPALGGRPPLMSSARLRGPRRHGPPAPAAHPPEVQGVAAGTTASRARGRGQGRARGRETGQRVGSRARGGATAEIAAAGSAQRGRPPSAPPGASAAGTGAAVPPEETLRRVSSDTGPDVDEAQQVVAQCEEVLMVRVAPRLLWPGCSFRSLATLFIDLIEQYPQSSIKRRLRDLVEGAETGVGTVASEDASDGHKPPNPRAHGVPTQPDATASGAVGREPASTAAGAAPVSTAPQRAAATSNRRTAGADRAVALSEARGGGAGDAVNPWQRAPKQKRRMAREFDPGRWLGWAAAAEEDVSAGDDAGPGPVSPAPGPAPVSLSQEEAELRRQAAALRAAEARLERKKRHARLRETAEKLCSQAQSQCEASEAKVGGANGGACSHLARGLTSYAPHPPSLALYGALRERSWRRSWTPRWTRWRRRASSRRGPWRAFRPAFGPSWSGCNRWRQWQRRRCAPCPAAMGSRAPR